MASSLNIKPGRLLSRHSLSMGRSLSNVCILCLLFTLANSFSIRQGVEGDNTILHLLEGNVTDSAFDNDGTDFDILSYLFTVSGRGHRLGEDIPGDVTILAPDDNAFRRAVGDLGLKTTSELQTYENFLIYLMRAYRYPFEFLTRILYYHVIPGELNSTVVLEAPSLVTWDTPSRITLKGTTLIDRNPDLPNPRFDTSRMDMQASNGVIHVIDYVLFPEVMRKIDISEIEDGCSSPEPTLEETGLDGGIGPFPVDSTLEATPTQESTFEIAIPGSYPDGSALEATPIEESTFETPEPRQASEELPLVTTLLSYTGEVLSPSQGPQEPMVAVSPLPSSSASQEEEVAPSQMPVLEPPEAPQSISPNPGPQEPTEAASLLPSENVSHEKEVVPYEQPATDTPEATSDSEGVPLSSPQETSSDVDALASPSPSGDTPEAEMPLEGETEVPTASASPIPSPNFSGDEVEPEDVIGPELPPEQATASSRPVNPDASSGVEVDDESQTPFSSGEARTSEEPETTDPEIVSSMNPEPSFSVEGPMLEE